MVINSSAIHYTDVCISLVKQSSFPVAIPPSTYVYCVCMYMQQVSYFLWNNEEGCLQHK